MLRSIASKPKPTTSKMVEVEDEEGNTQMGVVERMTADGEVVVRILATNKILTFTPHFPIVK